MARILDFDLTRGHKHGKYDWDILLDGQARELIHGQDFDCSRIAFRTAAYVAAKARGFKATCHFIGHDKIHLQAKDI